MRTGFDQWFEVPGATPPAWWKQNMVVLLVLYPLVFLLNEWPFDRVDVQSLISAMDDSVDQMQQTAKAIMLFEMVEFEDACELIRRRS